MAMHVDAQSSGSHIAENASPNVSSVIITDIEGLPCTLRDLSADQTCKVIVVYVSSANGPRGSTGMESAGAPTLTVDAVEFDHRGPARVALDSGIRHAMELISARFQGVLRLREVAAAAGLSPWHFSRSFKRRLGMSYTQYVASLRVSRAKVLLSGTALSVTEICYESGFNDLSHFERVFLRSTGASPSRYRRARRLASTPVSSA